jgi:hypothetical protein
MEQRKEFLEAACRGTHNFTELFRRFLADSGQELHEVHRS